MIVVATGWMVAVEEEALETVEEEEAICDDGEVCWLGGKWLM